MRRDFIVSFLSSVPEHVLKQFDREPVLVTCPVTRAGGGGYPGGRAGYRKWIGEFLDGARNVMPGIARKHGIAPADIGRVCVMGFSNGCIGVDEMLRCNDAFRFDAALAIDGIHGQMSWDGQLQPPIYKAFINFAAHASQRDPETDPDAPVMVISHSSIGPIMGRDPSGRIYAKSPSTTQTADLIWRYASKVFPAGYLSTDCGYGCLPHMHVERIRQTYAAPVKVCSNPICKMKENEEGKLVKVCSVPKCYQWLGIEDGWYDRRGANNLYVFGWGETGFGEVKTKDPPGYADHKFQAKVVLPALLEEFVVHRWNHQCFTVATSGLGQPSIDPKAMRCKLGGGLDYDAGQARVDYFPELEPDTSVPPPLPCPKPAPGQVLVGSQSDPCATVGEPVEPPDEGLGLGSIVLGLASAAGGYWLVRRFGR